jgi:hypothetical protein
MPTGVEKRGGEGADGWVGRWSVGPVGAVVRRRRSVLVRAVCVFVVLVALRVSRRRRVRFVAVGVSRPVGWRGASCRVGRVGCWRVPAVVAVGCRVCAACRSCRSCRV